jgi:hypothetical protein
MLLKCRDNFARYTIQCPPGSQIKRNKEGRDLLFVPDPSEPDEPLILSDQILIAVARESLFGVQLLSADPLN